MSAFDLSTPVGEIVARYPSTSRVFDRAGIDFCCGGKRALGEACQAKGLPADHLLAQLQEELATVAGEPDTSLADTPLPALARYIVERFHVPLREELPRLGRMAEKVLAAHGQAHPEVVPELVEIFRAFRPELEDHMAKEEAVLFPAIEALERPAPGVRMPKIAGLVAAMESEHDGAGAALARLRELTAGFAPPAGACNTFRALYDGLAHLETEMHLHVHLENSVLFPRAAALEQALASAPGA
ncbi:MAG: iron-sulfur cluster repair di-iron protein [Thermoanaerobaculia bacterium]